MAFARDVMERVSILLHDEEHTRWRLPELRLWINRAMEEISVVKPEACSATKIYTLVYGSRQTLPATDVALLDVLRNVHTNDQGRKAITVVAREVMDAQAPDWSNPAAFTPTHSVDHVIHNPKDQRRYFVYPPNDGTGRIEVVAAQRPSDVLAVGGPNQNDLASYEVALDIDDIYTNAIEDYVLFKAYSKDTLTAINQQNAERHYAAFAAALGLKTQRERSWPRPSKPGEDDS